MMAKHLTTKRHPQPSLTDGDGNEIYNKILLGIPKVEREFVFPKLEFVRLQSRQLLHDVGDRLKSGYFCNAGMISTLSVFSDGKSVEVGLIGKEGFAALPLIVGFKTSNIRVNVQIEGTAFRIDADSLWNCLRQCPTLARHIHQFSQIMAMQVTQIAACNRTHDVEERLARWLLMCADRVGSDTLPLTQDLLGQMLGTRRASVTIAAGILQKAGLIEYVRGRLHLSDRAGLENAACECYGTIRAQIQKWQRESS